MTMARVLLIGFFRIRGARPLKSYPDLARTCTCWAMFSLETALLVMMLL